MRIAAQALTAAIALLNHTKREWKVMAKQFKPV